MGAALAENVIRTILNISTTQRIETSYRWNLVKDADDNKFVDCAVAANAPLIVSHDRHFNVLKDTIFPNVKVISADEFKAVLARI